MNVNPEEKIHGGEGGELQARWKGSATWPVPKLGVGPAIPKKSASPSTRHGSQACEQIASWRMNGFKGCGEITTAEEWSEGGERCRAVKVFAKNFNCM